MINFQDEIEKLKPSLDVDNIEEAIYQISEHYAGLGLPESFFGGLLAVNGFEGLLADG